MNKLKGTIVLLSVTIFIAACGQAANTTTNSAISVGNTNTTNAHAAATPAPSIDQAAFAKDLFAKNCMICHKDSGKGGKVTIEGQTLDPDDLTTAKMKAKTDDKLAEQISEGAPDDGMPAFKEKLTPDQIKAVVRHVRILQGGPTPILQ